MLKKHVLAACMVLAANGVSAQSFDEVLQSAQNAVGEIGQYQQALQNPDARFQYALVQQMLKLDDPALQRIAKEHALFSTNPVMREAAIKAILDSRATLRFQLAGTGESYQKMTQWVTRNGGTLVNNRGEILIRAPEAVHDSCWGTERHCFFRQVGTTLQFNAFNGNNGVNSVMNLGNDGVLRGTIAYESQEVMQVQVDLKE